MHLLEIRRKIKINSIHSNCSLERQFCKVLKTPFKTRALLVVWHIVHIVVLIPHNHALIYRPDMTDFTRKVVHYWMTGDKTINRCNRQIRTIWRVMLSYFCQEVWANDQEFIIFAKIVTVWKYIFLNSSFKVISSIWSCSSEFDFL